jgi:ABC-2 type transport system permease protein
MDKLKLIIAREYLTRVKKKSFILATLLTPFAFVLFFVVIGFIFKYQGEEIKRIAVIDKGGILKTPLKDENNLFFTKVTEDIESLKTNFETSNYDGILLIPELADVKLNNFTIYYYSNNPPSLSVETLLKSRIERKIRDYKIEALAIERSALEALETRISLDPEPIKEGGANVSKVANVIGAAIGGIMGFVMYLAVFIYGMMVMRSVMEEKTTRIVEVMISSVKPFQLMMGKIIGVGGVGLTQVAVWAILIPSMMLVVNLVFGFDSSTGFGNAPSVNAEISMEDTEAMVGLAIQEIGRMNWWVILPLFVLYFLGGYFLYASLFAAVGSAMGDDLGEGQSLTLPITIPVILALYIMMAALESPDSPLAVGSSLFPLFSPIVMPARLAFGPPFWEIALSIIILLGTAVFFVWFSGRIYRVGILMYGKKVSFKTLGQWLFYKD